ncbi:MAG: metallophosphoesterase [Algoriphagus sp.]|uniref:T9SS type A sorting domain-containing protein n=1 Tax=Algoriphagus sp. TaxID=1872435 RepID=UPI0017F80B58|nr:T9SS type A sorting domain-containing protein [Algoriphagus sp.]NVJ86092.1 metallophosphoesterase [Algoriphagus sp.]
MKRAYFSFLLLLVCGLLAFLPNSDSEFRVNPYLQVFGNGDYQITFWSTGTSTAEFILIDENQSPILTENLNGEVVPEIYYTQVEKTENINGLTQGSWLFPDDTFKFKIVLSDLKRDAAYSYQVKLGNETFKSGFTTAPDKNNWSSIRFIALSDSETEPLGRVTRRAWYPASINSRPASFFQPWKAKFGTTLDQGFEISNYSLTEKEGYEYNLRVVNERLPDFMLMPGDLVQGSGYQPAWDEFWRHNAGEYDQGLSKYPLIPALGNWENFGAKNGGYGTNERGEFLPKLGRERFHAYFETPSNDPLQKHRQSYYRVDYGPITVLTLDSSNGTPDQKRSDFPADQKLKNQELTALGTDTQENYTLSQYQAAGGNDLSGFGQGTPQYEWLVSNLQDAQESKQLVFVQFHHIPYSSGEHGVPINHELATGQGGIPMRVLNPIFEEYGVIAVFAGHDELFERSFVDENQDGSGVLYYDVGVAGDGMRGEKRNYLKNPLELLNYNSFKKWTADQNEPEQWVESGGNPVLSDGGKHYGHLEVNVQKVSENGKEYAKIDFSPVYIFPVLDQNYNLQSVERRVYNDEVSLKVLLAEEKFEPVLKENVKLFLDKDGKASLSPEKVLVEVPDEDFSFEYSSGEQLDCSDLGEQELIVTSTRKSDGEIFKDTTSLSVIDTIAPSLEYKSVVYEFDLTKGELFFDVEDFMVSPPTDNCNSESIEVKLDKESISCSDLDSGSENISIELVLTVSDASGNSKTYTTSALVNLVESQKVSLSPIGKLYEGRSVELKLGEELDFQVVEWRKGTNLIEGEKGKFILVDSPGQYLAILVLENGCWVASESILLELEDLPFPSVKESIQLNLNAEGIAVLDYESVFESWPFDSSGLNLELSKTQFTCSDLGENMVQMIISDGNGTQWSFDVAVLVEDKEGPMLEVQDIEIDLDVNLGSKSISTDDLILNLSDNCSVKEVSLSKEEFTCEDIGKEIPVILRAIDPSGNVTEVQALVTVNRFEQTQVTLTGNLEFCEGEESSLSVQASGDFEVISWLRNGSPIPNQNASSLALSESGIYQAVIRYQGGCISESDVVEVKVNQLPKGEIEVNGDILIAPAGVFEYQWYRNGEIIPNATESSYQVNLMGEYSVFLTNQAGCTAFIEPVTLTIAGLGSRPTFEIKTIQIYPNPASETVKLEFPDDTSLEANNLTIYGPDGKNLTSLVRILNWGVGKAELEINLLPAGLYWVQLPNENQTIYQGKLIKAH